MKDITVLLHWTNMREITSYWFDVQMRTNFKQLFCATCRFPHSYLTYVQFAAGIMSYFLFHGIKLYNILIISCLVSIVKYNNINCCLDLMISMIFIDLIIPIINIDLIISIIFIGLIIPTMVFDVTIPKIGIIFHIFIKLNLYFE